MKRQIQELTCELDQAELKLRDSLESLLAKIGAEGLASKKKPIDLLQKDTHPWLGHGPPYDYNVYSFNGCEIIRKAVYLSEMRSHVREEEISHTSFVNELKYEDLRRVLKNLAEQIDATKE